MNGFLVIAAFLLLFMLGFPVVLAIAIPCAVYMLANGLPLDLIAQRTLYALDSFPLVAVPVFLFVGSLMNGDFMRNQGDRGDVDGLDGVLRGNVGPLRFELSGKIEPPRARFFQGSDGGWA